MQRSRVTMGFRQIIILLFASYVNRIYAYRTIVVDDKTIVLAMEDETITLHCENNDAPSICGFLHPNRTRYIFRNSEAMKGHCSMKFKARKLVNGIWKCRIGTGLPGVEVEHKRYVRVTDKLAALQQNMTAKVGKDVTLYCTTSKSAEPIKYCRFETPAGNPFSITEEVTARNPILNRYYYPKDKSLERGDCAVTIKEVKMEDMGRWTCGAGFENDSIEYTDKIYLRVEDYYHLSEGAVAAITIGVAAAIFLLITLGVGVSRKYFGHQTNIDGREAIEIREIFPSTSRPRSIPVVTVESPSPPETLLSEV